MQAHIMKMVRVKNILSSCQSRPKITSCCKLCSFSGLAAVLWPLSKATVQTRNTYFPGKTQCQGNSASQTHFPRCANTWCLPTKSQKEKTNNKTLSLFQHRKFPSRCAPSVMSEKIHGFDFFILNYFFIFLYYFNVLILKINLKKYKYIYYFDAFPSENHFKK